VAHHGLISSPVAVTGLIWWAETDSGTKEKSIAGIYRKVVRRASDGDACLAQGKSNAAKPRQVAQKGLHTLEGGREKGSNANIFIRRSCKCVPCSDLDRTCIGLLLTDKFPPSAGAAWSVGVGEIVSRLGATSMEISSAVDANRTAGVG
jgi:hypothetical protein